MLSANDGHVTKVSVCYIEILLVLLLLIVHPCQPAKMNLQQVFNGSLEFW